MNSADARSGTGTGNESGPDSASPALESGGETDADVVVVGGGPGGSTVAAMVAAQGHRVLLLEKERFPRYQIGESLLPATVHGICRLLGVADRIAESGFIRKRGGTFQWGESTEPWTFAFAASDVFSGPTSAAYQVERMKFDQILLNNAREKGAEVREGVRVEEVIESGGRVRGVVYTGEDGVRGTVRSQFVVDASGNTSAIRDRVGGARRYSEFFRNLALFGYFEGGARLPEPNSGNILCSAFDAGWFWYIPLSETLTSVGAVVRHDALDLVRGDREKALNGLIERCPLIADQLENARRVEDGPYGKIRVRKDYSYHRDRYWRKGMVLVGDAACFIDPVFSSGVHLATYSALLAARSINTVLSGGDAGEDACFEEFEARYRREYGLFHDFLISFYDLHQDRDSYFWSAKRITGSGAAALPSFAELVAGGASGETGLVDAAAYAGPEHESRRLELSGLLRRGSGDAPLFESEFVGSLLEEGAKIQVQAALGFGGDEDPVRDGGLVSSADGMHWAWPC
jgi:FAD-dependent halogenase